MKKTKEIKGANREVRQEMIRKHGDSWKVPAPKVFRDKKREASRRWNSDD